MLRRLTIVVLAAGLLLGGAPAAQAATKTKTQASKQTSMQQSTRADLERFVLFVRAASAADTERYVRMGFWSTFRKVAVCALSIAVLVGGNYLAITQLRKAGGVWKVARRTWRAEGRRGKIKVLVGVFSEILGIDQTAAACGL